MSTISAPILLIAFNRPDTTRIVFDYIRKAEPAKLYVALDGPRKGVKGEDILCNQVLDIVEKVDWKCDVEYKINSENKGAEITVSSAISWVFETEEYAIILEDDIIAPLSFLKFAQEMLIRYKDNEKIATVTGSNFTPIKIDGDPDYFFAKYGHSWGWATWKRFWEKFDLNLEIPKDQLTLEYLRLITNSESEARYYQRVFNRINLEGKGNSTWDRVALYYHRVNNCLSVIPRVNLTSNIGVVGLHAKGRSEHHFRSFDENYTIKIHPDEIKCETSYDVHHFKSYINKKKPLLKRLKNKIKKAFK